MEKIEKKILCVGVCVLDIIHVANEYPKEDSDTRSNHGRWQRGGNASNNCTVLSNLSVKSEFLGTFSDSKMFKFVLDDLMKRDICIDNCVYYKNCEVPLSSVILSEKTGSRTILHSNPTLPYLKYSDFQKLNLENYKWIHFEGRTPDDVSKMMEDILKWNSINESKIIISLDLEKQRLGNLKLAEFADYVFLGRDLSLFLKFDDMKSSAYGFRKLTKKINTIICPWGSKGVAVLDSNNQYFECKSYPPESVIDSLGAGDTFSAATIYALSRNKSINFSIEFASKMAGAKIGTVGYEIVGKIHSEIWDSCNN